MYASHHLMLPMVHTNVEAERNFKVILQLLVLKCPLHIQRTCIYCMEYSSHVLHCQGKLLLSTVLCVLVWHNQTLAGINLVS